MKTSTIKTLILLLALLLQISCTVDTDTPVSIDEQDLVGTWRLTNKSRHAIYAQTGRMVGTDVSILLLADNTCILNNVPKDLWAGRRLGQAPRGVLVGDTRGTWRLSNRTHTALLEGASRYVTIRVTITHPSNMPIYLYLSNSGAKLHHMITDPDNEEMWFVKGDAKLTTP